MTTATAMIPTAAQIASSKCHLERRSEWKYTRTDGVRYVSMPNSDGTRVYRVRADGRGCECRWYKTTLTICSHGLAAKEAAHHDAMNEWLADQVDDALAEEYDSQQATATTWRPCKRSCGVLLPPEETRPLCSGCAERALMVAFGGED